MKKWFLILLSVLLVIAAAIVLPSCDQKEDPAPSDSGADPSENVVIRVSGVTVKPQVMTLVIDQEETLTATVLPGHADNKAVTWESSDPSVLTVDENGTVKAIAEGTADVTVKTVDGGKTAVCKILVRSDPEPVRGVSLNIGSYTLDPDEIVQLFVSIVPANATNKHVTFTSSDEKVATVDEKGVVTGINAGEAWITVTTEDGGKSASCKITVNKRPIPVTGISLDNTTLLLTQGDSMTLNASVEPDNADNKTVVWTTSDQTVVSVKNGVVKALAAGTATVTAISADGSFKAECTVTVKPSNTPAAGVILNKTVLQLRVGSSETLTAVVFPENARDKTVTWSVDDPSIVTVDKGRLTALKEGTATVTVKTNDGGKTATCSVTVIANDDPIDKIDLSGSTEILDLGGYAEGLRVKTSKELLFSPNLNELRREIDAGASYADFLAYIRFTYLPEDDDEVEFTYHSICLKPEQSKGDWVDFFLQGDAIDCGFCPVAGATYRIELVVVRADDKTKGFCHGVYEFTAAEEFKESPYYRPTPVGGQTIRDENQFYIRYAPASENGYIVGETKQLLNIGQGSTEVIAVPKDGYQFVMWSDGVTTAARSGDTVKSDTKLYAYFTVVSESSNIANMYIFTKTGRPVTSKNYEEVSVVITNAPNGNVYNISAPAQMRGRGNSSWSGSAPQTSYDSKNSYRLKFDEKLCLLGIGDSKNRDWVLQANKFDLSGLRNWLVWDLANRMGTIPYVPECTWVQLYVNNEYRGMYMVCELIEAAKDRVEVERKTGDGDMGFLIEFDFRGNGDNDPYFYVNGYNDHTDNPAEFCIKSDLSYTEVNGRKVYDQDEINTIKNFMQRCHNAIMKGDRDEIDKLVDIPSLIDMYIIEELSKDCDVGRASFFVQRNPGGKLYFTAPWDFDFGFGTYGPANSTWGLVSEGNGVCTWYAALIENKWFRDEVVARMNELQDAFDAVMSDVRAKGNELEGAADMNAYFWNMYGRSFHQYVSGQVSRDLNSYDEHIDFLVDWSVERWDILREILRDY